MRRNKTRIIVILVVVVFVLIFLGLGLYVYLNTDLFKSNETLFFKYLSKNGEILEAFLEDENEATIEEIKQNQYSTSSKVSFNLESSDETIANEFVTASNFSIEYTANTDAVNNNKSSKTTLKFVDNELFTLDYIRNNDLYALKSNEVINKYLAIDNNNLKEFAEKLGVTDTSNIPDKIQSVDIKDIFSIDEDTKKEILTKYLSVINSQISKEKYQKQKNVSIVVNDEEVVATEYSIELTVEEVRNLITEIMKTLKDDETTLNIIVEKINLANSNNSLTISDLQESIQSMLDDLDSNTSVSDKTLIIAVYACDGELVKTKFAIGENVVTIDPEKSNTAERMVISIDSQEDDDDTSETVINKIEIANQSNNGQNTLIAMITLNSNDDTIKVTMQKKTNVSSSIKSTTLLNINISDTTYFTTQIDTTIEKATNLEIDELTENNSAIINDFSAEYIGQLSQAIINRLLQLYEDKVELINSTLEDNAQTTTNSTNTVINNTETTTIIENETNQNTNTVI